MTIDSFLGLFSSRVQEGNGWKVKCPAHDDHEPSLGVKSSDGKILLNCRVGCPTESVVSALGLQMKDLFDEPAKPRREVVATYDYKDEKGRLRDQKVRYQPKSFGWRHQDGGQTLYKRSKWRGLYRLPEVLATDPSNDIYVVEGEKDVDRMASLGAVATCSPDGADSKGEPSKKWIDKYTECFEGRSVVVISDHDEPGLAFAQYVATQISAVAASVKLVDRLPGVEQKGGDVSDYLNVHGHTLQTFQEYVAGLPAFTLQDQGTNAPRPAYTSALTIEQAHAVFFKWFGVHYDVAVIDALLATVAAERLDGDPVWLLIVGGPGDGKTETVQSAAGADAFVTSTIASEGALLSGTSKRDKAKDATGGLLRRIGDRGVLVIKDVTTILSMNREARASVLAALREIYDGKWERNLGSDGGKSLTWIGRIALIGAVTTAWDQAHSVISSMGDRFVLLRLDSTRNRLEKGRKAFSNTGAEIEMRAELAEVVGRVIAGINIKPVELTDDERDRLLAAADLVTRCRTGVEYDYQGKVIDAHMPEAPTRFLKQLTQIVRGACAIGIERREALNLAIRCARDSMPPLRLQILDYLGEVKQARTADVRRVLEKPWTTVDRQLQSMHMLTVLTCEEEEEETGRGADEATKKVWYFSLADGIDPGVLRLSPEMSSYGVTGLKSGDWELRGEALPTDKSGEGFTRRPDHELPF